MSCGKEKYYHESQKKYYPNRGKYCSMRCCYEYRRNHPTGKVWIDSHGYQASVVAGKQVRIHRELMEKKIGRRLMKTEHVHHINGMKDDNRLDNLIVLNDSAHHKLHHTGLTRTG
jgi:hypothetical protein